MNLTPHKHVYPPPAFKECKGCGFYCNDVKDGRCQECREKAK